MKLIWSVLLLLLSVHVLAARKSDDDLSLAIAQVRKGQVKNVAYALKFEFEKGVKTFEGQATLSVELARTDLPLSIDFLMKKIRSVVVNGKELKNYSNRRGSFDVPASALKTKTTISVHYQGEFSQEASGMQRAVDPTDGAEYIYTDFEPYYAHWAFPCFDQPDLKATYKVTVTAPHEWKAIQNERVESVSKVGMKTVTIFQESRPFSTYLFFVGAGRFVEWKDKFGELPLHLYARKSLEKYVDAEKIFETTKKGLKFFNEYFKYPYPFSQYGQIFIPEFAWGGMENPVAVTLNEKNIFRGPVPQVKYERRDNLILHEMAHMWFGDLVTMEWWSDLWLNESFATYISSLAQERALDSQYTWNGFLDGKVWGLWQDQLVTTHPIETPVPDVRTAKGNFDGITYAKGASALKQLHFFVGENGFRDGLRQYFKKFAFSNTKRADFITAIADASHVDLSDWTKKWLQTAGPNRVVVKPVCEKGEITRLTIEQAPSVSQTLSPHRVRLGLFEQDDDELELEDSLDVTYTGALTEVPEAIGLDCPDFILPNLHDQDFGLFSLDDRSLVNAKFALTALPDPLSRQLVWNILAQMVRDAKLPVKTFIEYAVDALGKEESDVLLGSLMGRRSSLRDQYQLYLTPAQRGELAPKMEKVLWDRMEKAPKDSSLRMNFFDFLVQLSQSSESLDKLASMLRGAEAPVTLDQDRRWMIVITLNSEGHKEAYTLLQAEKLRDNTTTGKRQALVARAAWPDLKNKKLMWKEFISVEELTHSDLEEAGGELHGSNYPQLSEALAPEIFKQLTTFDWKKHDDIVDVYFERFFPIKLCTESVLRTSEQKLRALRI